MRKRLMPLVLLGLVLLLGGGLWLATHDEGGRDHAAVRPGASHGAVSQAWPAASETPTAPPADPSGPATNPAEELTQPPERAAREARGIAITDREEELARALWVEGRVVLPAGTPPDESAKVVASGRSFEHGPQHAAAVGVDGGFKVAFAEATKTGWLELDARYLYLDERIKVVPREAGPVVIEARLGGVVRGRVLPPPDAPEGAQELVGKPVTLMRMFRPIDGDPGDVSLHRELDASLGFVFTAVPPDTRYHLVCDAEVYEFAGSEEFAVQAGKETIVDLQVHLGVDIAGRVVDDRGAPIPRAVVAGLTKAGSEEPGGLSPGAIAVRELCQETTDARGAFSLRGIPPGDIVLSVMAQGHRPLKHELGELQRGARRSGITLKLDRGMSIAGVVLLPDGTPAEGASVLAQPLEDRDELDQYMEFWALARGGRVVADASGRFAITGLGAGPHLLSASATLEEQVLETSKLLGRERERTVRTSLSTTVEGVAAGTLDLVVQIPKGETLRGLVIDERGNPCGDFRVTVRRKTPDGVALRSSGRRLRSPDGAFEVTALEPGTYRVEVEAEGYLDPPPLEVTVPLAGELAPVRLTRAAGLSGVVLTALGEPAPRAVIESARGVRFRRAGTADGRGRFELKDQDPGRVKVRAVLEGHAPSEPLEVELAHGLPPEHVTLRLRRGATLTGVVLDAGGRGAQGRSVELSGGPLGRSTGSRSAVTDTAGRFELSGLEPGTYSLSVPAMPHEVAALGFAETTGALDALSYRVEVELQDADRHVELQSCNLQAVRVFGTVKAGGRPAAGKVGVGFGDSRKRVWTPVDESGAFELAVPSPGDYSLSVQLEASGRTRYVEAAIQGPREQRLDVDLPAEALEERAREQR